ncbi:phosphate/phosphite/phosphonate ABC transporter substrate-binding protein [Leptothoe spongobia]|nr:PhnD/SsuA/transferrin family substrate-binding protein [Leptothoe spongobia]
MLRRRFLQGYGLLFLGSCALAKPSESTAQNKVKRPNKLHFAVTDLSGYDALEQDFGAFRQALEDMLQLPVEFFAVENYLAAAPALLTNELDFVMAGPSEYMLLRARASAVPVVGITRPQYAAMVMARMESDINQLSDLKGKTIAMRTEGSTAGHIMPMKLLLDAGVTPGDYDVVMLNRKGFDALQSGQVDAWNDSYDRYVEYVKNPGLEDKEIKVLAVSENLPPDVFVANPSLGTKFLDELRTTILQNQELLMSALLTSEANQKYTSSDLVAVADADYQVLRDSYYAIGQGSAIE